MRFVVLLVDIHDSTDVVDNIDSQLGQWRHLPADGRTLSGVKSENGQLRSDEVFWNVGDQVHRSGRAGVLGQRKVLIKVSEMGSEREKVVRTRPVLQPEVRSTLEAVLELVPEPCRWNVDAGHSVDRRRSTTSGKGGRSPDIRPKPRPRPGHEDRHRTLPVLLESVHVLWGDPCFGEAQKPTMVQKFRGAAAAIPRFTGFIHVQTVTVDVAIDTVLLVRRQFRHFVRGRLRGRGSDRLFVVLRQFLLPVLRSSRTHWSQTVDGRQWRLSVEPVSAGDVPLGHDVTKHSTKNWQHW